jgi:hypothetical protein
MRWFVYVGFMSFLEWYVFVMHGLNGILVKRRMHELKEENGVRSMNGLMIYVGKGFHEHVKEN